MNIIAAQQAARAVDLQVRSGGVEAALANLDLLNEIAASVRQENAKADQAAAEAALSEQKEAE